MRTFEITSPGMGRGDRMPARYTDEKHGGENRSMPLHVDQVPREAQSLAMMLVDRTSDYVHWLVVDIPGASDIRLPEDASRHAMPSGARELYNDAGFKGYEGPDPVPRTGDHRYELVAYALDVPTLDVDEHADWRQFRDAAEPHALATGANYWTYGVG